MNRFDFVAVTRFEKKPVPCWSDGSTQGIWEPVYKFLYELKRGFRVSEKDGKKGIWVYSKRKKKNVFIPLEKVKWLELKLRKVTPGILTAVITTTAFVAAFSPRARVLLKNAVFRPDHKMASPLLGRKALWFIARHPEAVEKAFLSARVPGFRLRHFGYFRAKGREGFLVSGHLRNIKDSDFTFVYGPRGNLQILSATVPKNTIGGNAKLFKLISGVVHAGKPPKLWFYTGQGESAWAWTLLGGKWPNKSAREAHKKVLLGVVKSSKAVSEKDAETLVKIVERARSPQEILREFEKTVGFTGKVLFCRAPWSGVVRCDRGNFYELLEEVRKRL